jgi:hypothetical protein
VGPLGATGCLQEGNSRIAGKSSTMIQQEYIRLKQSHERAKISSMMVET